jgi:chromosome segregation ATPase
MDIEGEVQRLRERHHALSERLGEARLEVKELSAAMEQMEREIVHLTSAVQSLTHRLEGEHERLASVRDLAAVEKRFERVERVVYGAVAIILTGFVGALVTMVLVLRPGS